jgi:hypothetical protein
VERRGPAVRNSSNNMGGRGEMIKAPIKLQDLRRKIYTKAKADTAWRYRGLRPEAAGLRLGQVE